MPLLPQQTPGNSASIQVLAYDAQISVSHVWPTMLATGCYYLISHTHEDTHFHFAFLHGHSQIYYVHRDGLFYRE